MTVTVKICGITSAEAAGAAIAAGAAYGGLNFHPASPRYLSPAQAKAISAVLAGKLQRVAVVADLRDADLAVIVESAAPEFLQLHGSETVARAAEIRARFGKPIIKVLQVADADDLKAVDVFAPVADLFLFDARPPKDALRAGGHGVAFDWTLLKGRNFPKPWFLAGGLTPDNVVRAIEASGAKLVDVSSGVETAPGVKSAARIADFIAAASQKVRA